MTVIVLDDRDARRQPGPTAQRIVPSKHYHKPRGENGPAYEIYHVERGPDGDYRDPSRPLGSAFNPIPPTDNKTVQSYRH